MDTDSSCGGGHLLKDVVGGWILARAIRRASAHTGCHRPVPDL